MEPIEKLLVFRGYRHDAICKTVLALHFGPFVIHMELRRLIAACDAGGIIERVAAVLDGQEMEDIHVARCGAVHLKMTEHVDTSELRLPDVHFDSPTQKRLLNKIKRLFALGGAEDVFVRAIKHGWR